MNEPVKTENKEVINDTDYYSKYTGREVVYVLLLKDDRYYVGKTSDLTKRIAIHKRGGGTSAYWLRLYPFVKVLKIYAFEDADCDAFTELGITLKMMSENGIDKVRGSCFSQMEFKPEKVQEIQSLIKLSSSGCFICGGNHLMRNCDSSSNICFKCGGHHWARCCPEP